MTQIKTSKGEYIFIEIYEYGYDLDISENNYLCYFTPSNGFGYDDSNCIKLPKGNWSFLCTTDTITEDIAKDIVDESKVGYINYIFGNNRIGQNVNHQHRSFQVALRSFNSLLESHNLSPSKTYAICKKIN